MDGCREYEIPYYAHASSTGRSYKLDICHPVVFDRSTSKHCGYGCLHLRLMLYMKIRQIYGYENEEESAHCFGVMEIKACPTEALNTWVKYEDSYAGTSLSNPSIILGY